MSTLTRAGRKITVPDAAEESYVADGWIRAGQEEPIKARPTSRKSRKSRKTVAKVIPADTPEE